MTKKETSEGLLPMRVVERATGIPADTIRVWERRYEAVTPRRTERNARRYTAKDIARLRLLRELSETGHAIGDIARLSNSELTSLRENASTHQDTSSKHHALMARYLEMVRSYEVRASYLHLSRTAALLPALDFALNFVAPLMRELGTRWEDGKITIAQEHIATGQVRNLLGAMIGQLSPPQGAPRIVIATPPQHLHEFGIMISAFVSLSRGVDPVYLGPNVPYDQLVESAKRTGAQTVLLGVARDLSEGELDSAREGLSEVAATATLWLGVPKGHQLEQCPSVSQLFHSFEALDTAILRASM